MSKIGATWDLKAAQAKYTQNDRHIWKEIYIVKTIIFGIYVRFRGGMEIFSNKPL